MSNQACQLSLHAVAALDLDGWRGLPVCTHADVDAALGKRDEQRSAHGSFREYPARAGKYETLTVHFDGDRVDAIGVGKPYLTTATFGAPEAKAPSHFYDYQQWIQASRGRMAFVDQWAKQVAYVYLFAPMSVEQYLKTWMASIEVHEFRVP